MIRRSTPLILWSALLAATQAGAQPVETLPDVVVTATGRPERVSRIAGTMQVITQEKIAHSSAKSVTDLLAENAVGFMSQWTAAQTSLNIRGAATEGQGRDFRSQVLILIDGHRAGTANLSKLSLADVERIEIVRGPSSVVYGSQNMGGVVNIIMKNGRTAPGNLFEAATGSWSLIEGRAQIGGTDGALDYYFGANAGTQSDYQVGGGQVERNTQWTRFGGTAALGWAFSDNHRVDIVGRTDGVYDAGFRGSSANLFAYDTRYNQSVDVTYNGKSADGGMSLMFQTYYVRDVDDLNNPSPLSTLNAVASRTNVDRNRRQLDILGTRFQPGVRPWTGNELLLGIDWERSWIRSERQRQGGRSVTQLSPQDNNQTENVFGFYVEDAQRFFEDRLTVRGGVRYTTGSTALDWTPNAPTLIPGTTNYSATTYSAGGTLRITDWLTTRAGASSGFRAPTATELGANFTTTPIGTTIFGNPGLAPETANQLEAGATFGWSGFRFDTAIFQNIISNRIQATTVSSVGGVVVQRYQNNPANIQVQGVEFQLDADVLRNLALDVPSSWRWNVFGNGYYNFKMTDYGAVAAAGTDMATRINQYQATVGTRFGQAGTELPWSLQILGILRGPMWYNTEEALSPIFFPGQVRNTTVYRKDPFWVWNTRGELEIRKGITLFAAVNNIFDVNDHPIFIALDQNPCRANLVQQNGSCGNSMPGREVIVGFQLRW
jgi:vitamin B12 transporter